MVLQTREELLAKLKQVAGRKGLFGLLFLRCLRMRVLCARIDALSKK